MCSWCSILSFLRSVLQIIVCPFVFFLLTIYEYRFLLWYLHTLVHGSFHKAAYHVMETGCSLDRTVSCLNTESLAIDSNGCRDWKHSHSLHVKSNFVDSNNNRQWKLEDVFPVKPSSLISVWYTYISELVLCKYVWYICRWKIRNQQLISRLQLVQWSNIKRRFVREINSPTEYTHGYDLWWKTKHQTNLSYMP